MRSVSPERASLSAYLTPVLSTEACYGNFGLRPRVVTLRHPHSFITWSSRVRNAVREECSRIRSRLGHELAGPIPGGLERRTRIHEVVEETLSRSR